MIYKHFFVQLKCSSFIITISIYLSYLLTSFLSKISISFLVLIFFQIIEKLSYLLKLLFVSMLISFILFRLIFLNVLIFYLLILQLLLLILILLIIRAFFYLFPVEFSFFLGCSAFINIFSIKIILFMLISFRSVFSVLSILIINPDNYLSFNEYSRLIWRYLY